MNYCLPLAGQALPVSSSRNNNNNKTIITFFFLILVQHQTYKTHRNPTGQYLDCSNEFPNICVSLMSKVLLKNNDSISYLFHSVRRYISSVPYSYLIVMHFGTIIFLAQNLNKVKPLQISLSCLILVKARSLSSTISAINFFPSLLLTKHKPPQLWLLQAHHHEPN